VTPVAAKTPAATNGKMRVVQPAPDCPRQKKPYPAAAAAPAAAPDAAPRNVKKHQGLRRRCWHDDKCHGKKSGNCPFNHTPVMPHRVLHNDLPVDMTVPPCMCAGTDRCTHWPS